MKKIVPAFFLLSASLLYSSGNHIPERIEGVELDSLGVPVVFASRYPIWVLKPDEQINKPFRGIPGKYATAEIVRQENEELDEFGIKVDVLSFNASININVKDELGRPSSRNLERYKENYFLPSVKRPFLLLYEHVTPDYRYREDDKIDMSLPHNREIFFRDIEFMLERVIIPYQHRYVTVNGRAMIYIWASGAWINPSSTLREAKRRYPIFFIGAERGNAINPSQRNRFERIAEFDALMPYGLYGTEYVGRYTDLISDYAENAHEFSKSLQFYFPNIRLFACLQIAADDYLLRKNKNPPLYPNSVDEARIMANMIRTYMDDRIFDPVVHVVFDENYEGAAIQNQKGPQESEREAYPYYDQYFRIRQDLSGTTRLEIVREFFK